MEHLIYAVEKSIVSENWYSALTVSLTLPDICGKIDYPNAQSRQRYSDWFKVYVQPKYTIPAYGSRIEEDVLLGGNDCYALRCAFLHEGSFETETQRASELIKKFHFTVPAAGMLHSNQFNDRLQLQVDLFCSDILFGVRAWLNDIAAVPEKQWALEEIRGSQIRIFTDPFDLTAFFE